MSVDIKTRQARTRAIKDHVWGPLIAVVINLILVTALVKYMVFDNVAQEADIEVLLVEPDAVDLEDLEEVLEQLEELPEMDIEIESDVDFTETPPEVENFAPSEEFEVDFAALDIQADVSSALVMVDLYAGRSASGRKKMLGKYGGRHGQAVEQSILRALEWLRQHQNGDGSWNGAKSSAEGKIAMTGLAILTFLAHGETPTSEKYGETVQKAIQYLVSKQKGDGLFCAMNNHGSYAHAIATYALAEAYSLTRIPDLKPVVDLSTSVIVTGQQDRGLWEYGYKKAKRWDLSVTGWQVQALKAAYFADADVSGLKDAMKLAADGIEDETFNEGRGAFTYSPDGSPHFSSMTPVGVLSLQLLGRGDHRKVSAGLNFMKSARCEWDNSKEVGGSLYGWYYLTQAKFQKGKNTWRTWNSQFAGEYVKNQNGDGSWSFPAKESGDNQGPVYSTTLSALTLMVYYRHLPSYKPSAVEEPEGVESDDDVDIEIS